MKFFIRQWSEDTIVLMTEMGHVLAYFSSVTEAINVCNDWYKHNAEERQQSITVQYLKPGMGYENVVIA